MPRGCMALCPCCRGILERTGGRSLTAGLACAISAHFAGHVRQARLATGIVQLGGNGWVLLAVLLFAVAVVLPFVRFGLLILTLACLRFGRTLPALGWMFRWSLILDLWSMPDVCLIGCAIGYSRAAAQTHVSIDAGGLCFIAAALLAMLTRATLDRRTIWRRIAQDPAPLPLPEPLLSCLACDLVLPATREESRCPRCRARLYLRRPDSMVRTLALLIAAALLYIPANLYPMSVTHFLSGGRSYRIIDGVLDLVNAGLWPLAMLVFFTSIAIPALKLTGLGWCMFSVRRRSRDHLVFKTSLYRQIDGLGRWSAVDPLTVPLFLPLFHFRDLVISDAGAGAPAFMAVVVITLLASRSFDPRLMWDAAERLPATVPSRA